MSHFRSKLNSYIMLRLEFRGIGGEILRNMPKIYKPPLLISYVQIWKKFPAMILIVRTTQNTPFYAINKTQVYLPILIGHDVTMEMT